MRASELKLLARDWLRRQYPQSVIVFELSIGAWGSSSLDVAAITDDEIIGVEIKGEGDSPTRLKLQAASYSKAATRMYLLTCPDMEARVHAHRPDGWGLLKWDRLGGSGALVESEHIRPAMMPTAAAQLVQALWADELKTAAAGLADFLPVGVRARYRHDIGNLLAEHVPLAKLRPAVCRRLMARDWAGHYPHDRISLPAPSEAA